MSNHDAQRKINQKASSLVCQGRCADIAEATNQVIANNSELRRAYLGTPVRAKAPKSDGFRPASEEVDRVAGEYMRGNGGLSYESAMEKVRTSCPELWRAYSEGRKIPNPYVAPAD